MGFYDNFVRLCSEKGLPPTKAAIAIGVDRSAATRWSKGAVPRYTQVIKLADFFGVSVEDLMSEEPIRTNAEYASADVSDVADVAKEAENEKDGLENALEALRNQPGRRALLSVTRNMSEAQVLRFADWLADVTGGNKD